MTWQNRIVGYGEEAPDQLLANPANWRTHPKSQTDALAGVLREVGLVQNVIVNRTTGFVVDGHARIALALRDGQPSIPVTYVELGAAEEALILASLDPIGAMAGADAAKLDALLREVSTGEAAVQEMLSALAEEHGVVGGLPEMDDAPVEVDEASVTRTQPGDVWRVGRHTVACLDSTDRANVERLTAGRRVVMVWSDPPYGIDIAISDGKRHGKSMVPRNKFERVIGDKTTETAERAIETARELLPDALHIWWGANNYAFALPGTTCWLVWDKKNDKNDFADCELAWCSHTGAVRVFRHMWSGLYKDSERGERRVHPTQKPIALCAWAFDKYGAVGDVILDPFLGSGPSLKAAEKMGRTVVGFELSPAYVDHILEWAEAEGLTVERADGST